MNKKLLIIIAAAGLASFIAMFGFALFTAKSPTYQQADSNQPESATAETTASLHIPALSSDSLAVGDAPSKKIMTEKQLKSLVYEVREKIEEYKSKLSDIEVRGQRLQTSQETLKKEVENLDNLRIELTSIVAALKSKRNELLKTRIEIEQSEKANIISIAATYDKMDATSAGKILSNMCSRKEKGDILPEGKGFDDAVKILYYMADRTKAKVLAELVNTEPKLAASFSQKLKQITEVK